MPHPDCAAAREFVSADNKQAVVGRNDVGITDAEEAGPTSNLEDVPNHLPELNSRQHSV